MIYLTMMASCLSSFTSAMHRPMPITSSPVTRAAALERWQVTLLRGFLEIVQHRENILPLSGIEQPVAHFAVGYLSFYSSLAGFLQVGIARNFA
jgi:hypothetical protein